MKNTKEAEKFLQSLTDHKFRVLQFFDTFTILLKKQIEKHNYANALTELEWDDCWKFLEKIKTSDKTKPNSGNLSDMNLIDIVELLFDLASEADGNKDKMLDLLNSHKIRLNMSKDLYNVLVNTAAFFFVEDLEMIPVESSTIRYLGYNDKLQEAVIEFMNGSAYKYFDVSKEEFDNLKNSKSIGGHLASNIKNTKSYQKLY